MDGFLLSPSGLVAATVSIPHTTFSATTLVSDGNGSLLLAGEVYDCPFELCYSAGLRATRLGPDLQRVDAEDLVFSEEYVSFGGAVWDGSRYSVLWTDHESRLARVPVSPAETIVRTKGAPFYVSSIAAMGDGTLAFTGSDSGVSDAGAARPLGFLSADGSWSGAVAFESSEQLRGMPRVISLPGGGVAYIASSIQNDAPHHGSSHVMMAIAKTSFVPPRPDAPYATTRLTGGSIAVDWTAPAGALNGFRVEYRIDNGPWIEVDEWFPAGTHHASIAKPAFGTSYAVRVRAFNDGGASAYSAAALTQPTRRRAVH
jgi:hypothetical protein